MFQANQEGLKSKETQKLLEYANENLLGENTHCAGKHRSLISD